MLSLFTTRNLDLRAALSPDQAVAKLRAQIDRGQLRGRVQTEGCALCLRGTVRTPFLLRLFVWSWFGLVILWSAGAFVAAQEGGPKRWMPLGGLVFFIGGVLFFLAVNQFVAQLADKLELVIREALASVA